MSNTLIIHHSLKRKQYFFSTDHCQGVKYIKGKGVVRRQEVPEDFVPVTVTLPMFVAPRPILPNGWVRTKEDYVKIFCDEETEIPNPELEYQPVE